MVLFSFQWDGAQPGLQPFTDVFRRFLIKACENDDVASIAVQWVQSCYPHESVGGWTNTSTTFDDAEFIFNAIIMSASDHAPFLGSISIPISRHFSFHALSVGSERTPSRCMRTSWLSLAPRHKVLLLVWWHNCDLPPTVVRSITELRTSMHALSRTSSLNGQVAHLVLFSGGSIVNPDPDPYLWRFLIRP